MLDRTRWSAFGAAVAVTLIAGIALPSASATNTAGGGAGTVFVPIVPCRLFDTRAAASVGPRTTPLSGGETFTQQVAGTNGNCVIPPEATAVAMNVTTVNANAISYLTIWPADAAQPLASNLNWIAGSPATPNKVDVKLSATGAIKLFDNAGTVDVLADVVGYYADHNHDDRYYTKAEIDATDVRHDAYPATSIQLDSTGVRKDLKGCISSNSVVGSAKVPIIVPTGARLISVDIATYDGLGSSAIYGLNLSRISFDGAAYTPTALQSTSRGNLLGAFVHDVLAPPVDEIVALGETFEVQITGLDSNANGFCGMVVTYDTSG
jgi:hypothetical protein